MGARLRGAGAYWSLSLEVSLEEPEEVKFGTSNQERGREKVVTEDIEKQAEPSNRTRRTSEPCEEYWLGHRSPVVSVMLYALRRRGMSIHLYLNTDMRLYHETFSMESIAINTLDLSCQYYFPSGKS